MKTIKFLAIAMLLSCGFAAQVSAIDHYWIGTGGNTNWSTPGNWATTSGAAVSDVSFPPTINDNVIFDQNSFTTTRRTVTVNVASTCDSIIYRNIPAGVFNIPVLILNATLTVGGSVLLWPGMDIGASGQTIRLESTRLNETFSITGGETRINITFTGSANWTIDGNLLAKNVYLPHLTFSSTGNLTVNSDLNVYRFTFSSAGNLTVNGNLNATIVSVSGNGNVQILGNVNTTISASGQGFTSINKTGSGNMNISGNLFMSLGGATSSTTSFRFSDGGDLTIGGYALIEGAFSFSGDGNLTINNYLKTGIAIGDFGNQVITLNGTGTKIIKGDVTSFNGGISVNGGVVDIQGDLITSRRSGNNGSEANQPTPVTGANPNISGGCKITITGNILNAHSLLLNAGRLSISGAGTEVEVKGGYATLYDLYIVDGAKLIGLTETVELYGGWYNNNGGVDFTAATAPKLIRIGIGDFIANVNDVYNNVVVTNNPAAVYLTNNGYHTINRGNYNSIIIEKGSGRISTASQGVTTDSLIIKSQAEYIFSNTTAVNEHLEIKPPVCGGMTTVSGGTIAMGAGSTVDVEYLLLKNNTITGATPFDANNSIDAGENSGWNISGVPKTFYWVGGTGNWDDINHWADSPGGTPGSGCIPTLLDNVVFDGASGTVTIPANYPAYCNNMTWSGTGTARLTLTDAVGTRLYIGGSLELKSGMTVTNIGGSGTTITDDGRGIHFVSTRANETVSANGVAIGGNV